MRKLFAIAVAAALLVGITALAYGAGKGPAPKATGEVWFDHPIPSCGVAHCRFNAHDGDSVGRMDKGNFYYSDDVGYYVLDIYDVVVDAPTNSASFSGNVEESNYPGIPVGDWVNIKVLDGGTPGRNGDFINGAVGKMADDPNIPITDGNLVVHTYE